MKNETLHIRLKANMQKSLKNFKTWLALSVFVLLGAIVPQEAKANYDSRGLWYFDNTNTKWTNVYLIVGRGDWTQAVKMVLQYDNIYKAESTWDNTYAFFFADSDCGYSTGSGSGKDIVGSRTGNYTGNFTSKPSNNIFSPSGNGTNITGTWSTAYHLKHPWGTGKDSDWSWKVLKYNDGVYTLKALYASGKGCNYSKPNSTDEAGYDSNPTLVGSPTTGDECTFTFNPSNNKITITKVVTCNDNPDFLVSLSKSEVAVGCTGVTASIEGNDRPTVTWSSDNPSVATIDASTGAIIINAAGKTTIKATTTEDGGFCGGVEKPATLTVKSPSVTVEPNKTSLCAGEELILTATVTNAGTGNTYQWYKGDNSISGATSAAYTINSVSADDAATYKVAVSGGILCQAKESAGVIITVNELPSAPTLTTNTTNVCPGTLTLSNFKAMAETNTVIWYSDETCKQEVTTPTVEKGNQYTFYAKAKNTNNCFSEGYSTLTVTVYDDPKAFTLTTDPTEICSGADVVISISNKQEGVTYKLDGTAITEESIIVYPTSNTTVKKTYTVVASLNACPALTKSITTEEITVNPVPLKPSFVTDSEVTCPEKPVNPNLSNELTFGEYLVWYDEYGNLIGTDGKTLTSGTKDGESKYYAAVSNGACESADRTLYTVDVEADPIEDLTIALVDERGNELPADYSYCQGDDVNVKLTYNGGIYWGAPEWNSTLTARDMNTSGLRYDAKNKKGEGTYTISNLQASGTLQVALTMCGDTKATSNVLNVNITPKAETPTVEVLLNIEKCGNDITQYGKIQVTPYNAGYTYKINETDITPNNNGIVENLSTAGSFTLSAINSCKVSTPSAPFTISETDNKPTISISGSEKAVFYEDVTLTATATDGATVKWYEGGVEKGEGLTYVVTSATEPSKTVTAQAFLNGCESAVASHTVAFSAEDCAEIPSNDIQITFTHPAKNDNNAACQYWGFGYIFKDGVTPNNNRTNYLAVFPDKDATSGSKTVTLSNVQTAEIKVYLNAYHNYSDCRASTKVFTLQRGKKYSISISTAEQGSGDWEKTASVTQTGSLTKPKPITAPAVKMVSAEYDEELEKIVATGAVYKTGCGETFWGFQYSTDGQTWGTADVDFIHPSGNSLSVPGEFDYSFAIPKANGGETYYIRAYALNNYNGSYALSNAVYSTTSLPVEIPSKTIESATIALVEPSTDTEVCPQSTVYLKVSYVGGDFTDFVAEEDFPGTDLKLVNHDKVNNYAIFSFTATATGTANITISNNSGSTVTPADGVSITLKDVQVATPPTIYLEKNTICDNQTTNVVVNSPIVGLSYSLKNGSVGDPVTYESGDLKFPVSKEGSYTVQVQETVCGTTAISAPVDLRVITSDVKITLTTDVNTITPWQPLTLTVKAPSGYDYYLKGLDDETVYTKSGDVYTIKFRRPESWGVGNSKPDSEPETKTFIAGIKIGGEEDLCSTTTKEIQLVDTKEVCLAPGN